MTTEAPLNPVTLEPLEVAPPASGQELDDAVAASVEAMSSVWPRDHRRRSEALYEWASNLRVESESLADQIVAESGKTIEEARAEVAGSIDSLRYNAGLARLPLGRAGSLHDGSHAHLIRQPVGPTVFITPWNWPVLLLLRDLAPAFAAGVTALVKPSPQTDNVTRRVIALGHRAGVPLDALQCVSGGPAVGSALVRHAGTAAVAITGSTAAGQAVMRDAAETLTRPLLELGGKATMLVLPDADLRKALETASAAAVITAGQMCMACTRVVVHQDLARQAEEILSGSIRSRLPGDPREPGAGVGPLISETAMSRVVGYVDLARSTGRVAVGGEEVHPGGLPGHFLTPALVTDLDVTSPVVQDDVFGPLLVLETYASDDEGVERVNATPFGLAASVWSADSGRALRAASDIRAGTVWINGYNRSYAEMPSGGMGMSGLGRTRGVEGIEQFTELKHIHFST